MAKWGWSRRRRRARPPRQVEGGIAARTRRGAIGESWWSERFVAVLEALAIGSRLQRGRTYARSGQVLELRVEPGLVQARVQGSRREPYQVRITVDTLPGRAWMQVEEALAEQALFAARLLAGEMPHEIEDLFAELDLSLFPESTRELETDCSCPDFANPCKHVAATYYILAEAFDEDPFLIFAWRGRTRDRLVENLRALRRAAAAEQEFEEPAVQEASEEAAPLSVEGFWRTAADGAVSRVAPHASVSPDALLRQLGPPPPEAGGSQLLEHLAGLYRAMASGAERIAYAAPAAQQGDETAPAGRGRSRGARGSKGKAAPRARRQPRFYITDMSHFPAGDADAMPPPARRLYDFFVSVVLAGTSIRAGSPVDSVLRCRRRLGRSPCRGRLVIHARDEPPEIEWRCAECGEAGVLRGWECSLHDLGGRFPPDPGEPAAETTLTEADYGLLDGLEPADIGAEQLIRGATWERGTVRLAGTVAEFDALVDEIEVALGEAGGVRRARLKRVLDRIAAAR